VKRRLTLGLLSGLLCGGETLTIRLYDLVNTPAGTVEHASDTAGQLLAGAGVKVIWEKGAANSEEGRLVDWSSGMPGIRRVPDSRGYLVVRLAQGPPDDFPGANLGYALPSVWQGVHVTVYYDRVEKLFFGSKAMPSVGSLVGAAIAHEIGHVLLGSAEHSAQGIMKGDWGPAEFRLLACGRLQFTPEESAGIRAGVYRRAEAVCVAGAAFFNSASINGFKNCN
jgi:hypothetical protein